MRVVKNIAWLILDKLCLLISNFVVLVVVANHYGATDYGMYQYASSIVLILEIITQLIDGRIVKKRYGKEISEEYVVNNATLVKLFLSIVSLLCGATLSFFGGFSIQFKLIFCALLLDNLIRNMKFGMENRFEYNLESRKCVIASDIGLISGAVLQVWAVNNDYPLRIIAIIQLISTSIGFIILYVEYRIAYRDSIRNTHLSFSLCREMLIESLPIGIAAMASVIYTRCDSVMLGVMMTTKEVGIYYVATRLISVMQMAIAPVHTSLFVKLLELHKDRKAYEKYYLKISGLMTWLSIAGVLFSFVVLPFFFMLFKEEYLPSLSVYKVLSIEVIFCYNAILRSSHFTIVNKTGILLVSQILTMIINVILNIALISMIGIIGAAIATVISQFISLFLSNLLFKDARFVFEMQMKAFNPFCIFIS